MKRRHVYRAVMGLAGLVLSLGANACGGFQTYCEDLIDCHRGNEADVDACIVQAEAQSDRASLFGCDDYFDALQECVEDKARCRNNVFTPEDSCKSQNNDYNDCMRDSF